MFAHKRTPFLGAVFGVLLAVAVVLVFEEPGRPFSLMQLGLLVLTCCLPGLGLAMLMDPKPQQVKAEYLKINFYEDPPPKG
jgi:hypothetical protein